MRAFFWVSLEGMNGTGHDGSCAGKHWFDGSLAANRRLVVVRASFRDKCKAPATVLQSELDGKLSQ